MNQHIFIFLYIFIFYSPILYYYILLPPPPKEGKLIHEINNIEYTRDVRSLV